MAQKNKSVGVALSKVVLYKHGIGYFERHGEVGGGSSLTIDCAADAVDDLLKSLVIIDPAGASGASVTYDCAVPAESRLAQFGVDMRKGTGLIDLIGQMKGTP